VLTAFWLAAGAQDKPNVAAAQAFRQLLLTRVANVPLVIIPGDHQGSVWRALAGGGRDRSDVGSVSGNRGHQNTPQRAS
jgi:hypothetical protein